MLQAKPNNIVLTGGHAATTAVAFTEEIKSQSKNWKIYWIGVKNAIEGKKMATLESEVLPRLGVKFLPITTGRLQRKFTIWTIPSLMKIPCGFAQSVYFLLKIKPKVKRTMTDEQREIAKQRATEIRKIKQEKNAENT